VHRWWAYLQSFDFKIEYREGKRMAHVDFLSRNHIQEATKVEKSLVPEKRVNLAEISSDWLAAEQRQDSKITDIIIIIMS